MSTGQAPATSVRGPRRDDRLPWLPWVAGVILVAGVVAALIAFDVFGIRNTANSPKPQIGTAPAEIPVRRVVVKPSQEALKTITRWLDMAPARKNLAASYELTDPELRQGMTRAEWATGTIPVIPYPVWDKGAGYSPHQVQWSYKDELMLQVLLTANKGVEVEPTTFWVGAKRSGSGADARWRVHYFAPRWQAPVPNDQ